MIRWPEEYSRILYSWLPFFPGGSSGQLSFLHLFGILNFPLALIGGRHMRKDL
jgi:hypothetical protein